MGMTTGENDQGLRKILDLTRLLSISILLIHFYINCYNFFESHDVTHEIVNQFVLNLLKFNLFQHSVRSKLGALLLLIISLVGAKGKKDESISIKRVGTILIFGTSLYLVSTFLDNAILYMTATSTGYLLMLMGGTQLSRLVQLKLGKDIFNKVNQSFPQEERLIENEYSVNLPTTYVLKNQVRKGWINVVNPFRATLVIGTPGAGKSYFVIRHVITAHHNLNLMIMESTNEKTLFEVAEIQLTYRSKVSPSLRPKITSSRDAYQVLNKYWDEGKIDFVEQFKVLLLNRANKVIGIYEVSSGTTVNTVADPKSVFVAALKANACGVIIAHNHPSGNLTASQADIKLTKDLKDAGKFLHIPVLDHIIITSESYYSFADEGLL